jgi:hypothetical protein
MRDSINLLIIHMWGYFMHKDSMSKEDRKEKEVQLKYEAKQRKDPHYVDPKTFDPNAVIPERSGPATDQDIYRDGAYGEKEHLREARKEFGLMQGGVLWLDNSPNRSYGIKDGAEDVLHSISEELKDAALDASANGGKPVTLAALEPGKTVEQVKADIVKAVANADTAQQHLDKLQLKKQPILQLWHAKGVSLEAELERTAVFDSDERDGIIAIYNQREDLRKATNAVEQRKADNVKSGHGNMVEFSTFAEPDSDTGKTTTVTTMELSDTPGPGKIPPKGAAPQGHGGRQ